MGRKVRRSIASPCQPHYDPPNIPSCDIPPPSFSDVPPPPPFYVPPPSSSDLPPPSSFYVPLPLSLYAPDSLPSSDEDSEADDDEEEKENTEEQLDNVPTYGELKEAENATRLKILSTFTEAQMNRYEAFRRSGFKIQSVNRLLTRIVGKEVLKETSIVVAVIGKMFVGELVETARVVMTGRNDSGPIRPSHIRESYRRLKLNGRSLKSKSAPRLSY